jgi:hypothetical protein
MAARVSGSGVRARRRSSASRMSPSLWHPSTRSGCETRDGGDVGQGGRNRDGSGAGSERISMNFGFVGCGFGSDFRLRIWIWISAKLWIWSGL